MKETKRLRKARRTAMLAEELTRRYTCPYCGSPLITNPFPELLDDCAANGTCTIGCSDNQSGCPDGWAEWYVNYSGVLDLIALWEREAARDRYGVFAAEQRGETVNYG